MIDNFGVPLSLTYKNEQCIKTFPGGIATILARLLTLSYLAIQCANVLNHNHTITYSLLKRDLSID